MLDIRYILYYNYKTIKNDCQQVALKSINDQKRSKKCGKEYEIAERRPGDIAICYADTTKAKQELNFTATHTLQDMCRSSYEFEKNNK